MKARHQTDLNFRSKLSTLVVSIVFPKKRTLNVATKNSTSRQTKAMFTKMCNTSKLHAYGHNNMVTTVLGKQTLCISNRLKTRWQVYMLGGGGGGGGGSM